MTGPTADAVQLELSSAVSEPDPGKRPEGMAAQPADGGILEVLGLSRGPGDRGNWDAMGLQLESGPVVLNMGLRPCSNDRCRQIVFSNESMSSGSF